MAVKYVFVTGGVVSGLGKESAASLGRLLKARIQSDDAEIDPCINIDPGTI